MIDVRIANPDGTCTTRSTVLSCDEYATINYISSGAATELGQEPHPIDKEANPWGSKAPREDIKGYIDLDWRFENSTREWYTTSFYVTSTNDPPYDAVLGRREAEQLGMIRSRGSYKKLS